MLQAMSKYKPGTLIDTDTFCAAPFIAFGHCQVLKCSFLSFTFKGHNENISTAISGACISCTCVRQKGGKAIGRVMTTNNHPSACACLVLAAQAAKLSDKQ